MSSYGLSEFTVFIRYTLKCFLVFPKDMSFCSTYFFVTLLCNSIKQSKYVLFADTIKIAPSISSATDITPPQCHWFFCGRCAADLWNLILTKLKSEVQCWLCIVLIKQNVGTHMYIDLLLFYY